MAEPELNDTTVLSINAAAQIAGVSRAWLYKAIERGALKSTDSEPATVTWAALQQWMDSRSPSHPNRPTRLRAVDNGRDGDAPSRVDESAGAVQPPTVQPPADREPASQPPADSVAWSIVASQQDTIAAQNRIISEQLRVLAEQSATIATMVDDLLQRAR